MILKNACPDCAKPLQFKLMTSLIFGFIPSCNKIFECTNCKKIIVKLNWFLVIVYFHFGLVFFWLSIILGFKKQLPWTLNIFNIMLGLGAYVILVKGFVLRYRNKSTEGIS